MQKPEERGIGAGLVFGGIGGAALATVIAGLIAARPAAAAPLDEKLDYLIEVLTALVPVLAEVAEGQTDLIAAMQQWLPAQGVPGVPGVEVTVRTDWVAKEPEQIYSHAIRAVGTFYTDRLVDWTKGKRLVFKIESSLNVACQVQVIGNFVHDIPLASNINGIINIAADENHTIGMAWDDWHPFVGLRITTAAAPTAGILTIWAVIQE